MKRTILTALLVACTFIATTTYAAVPDRQFFKSPEQAAAQLVEVMSTNDVAKLFAMFGPHSEDLVSSGDPIADRASRKMFVALAAETYHVETDAQGNATLLFGYREWPFPIPLVQSKNGWSFDAERGKEEILNRRIGKNEYEAIDSLRSFVSAQEEYFDMKPRGVAEYAQRFASSPGDKDGLFWPRKPRETMSPLGPLVIEAQKGGYKTRADVARAFHGYRFRILTRQGAAAPGGALDYLDAGKRLSKGFAFVAYPADWGSSGIMTFIVNKDGKIYERNLGPQTATRAEAITEYNPSKEWRLVELDESEPKLFEGAA